MKNSLRELQVLQETLQEQKEEYQKDKAEYDFYLKKLEEDFNCKDIKGAEKLLEKLIKEKEKLIEKFDSELEQVKSEMEKEGLL
jgi:hypothetical protein